jgi:hypothetical protein
MVRKPWYVKKLKFPTSNKLASVPNMKTVSMPASTPQGAVMPGGIRHQTIGSQGKAGEAATLESRQVVGSGILSRGSRRPPHTRRNRGGWCRRRHIATVEARS